ncbi:MAG: hypothetical protein PUE54_10860 [Bacteroidales bacterium]|nr:hypothetical protein [Bacteroidales bacterium]
MNEYIKKVLQHLALAYGPKAIDSAKEHANKIAHNFLEQFKSGKDAEIFSHDVAVLDMKTLTEISRKYCIEGSSNGVAAMKVFKDNLNFVYLAYVKDRELLPVDQNHYVVIKATALTPEVINSFEEDELIIIK